MWSLVVNKFKSINQDQRSKAVYLNSAKSLLIKGLSLITGFFLVPVQLDLIGKEHYGIWVSIVSLMNWIFYLDIGLGNGLRNEYAIANSNNDFLKAKKLVSTSYITIFFFISFLMIIFFGLNAHLNWNILLNTNLFNNHEINCLIFFVVFSFLLRFLFQLVNFILLAEQKSYIGSFFPFISNLLVLLSIIVYNNSEMNIIDSFTYLVFMSSLIPLLVVVVYNFYFFLFSHKHLYPSFSFFDFSLLRNLSSVGIKFFLLQISSIVIFSLSNLIIIHLLDENSVSDFNILFQLFGYITTFFMIIISPYWSAYTDAYYKGDYKWMMKTYRYIKKIWLYLILLVVLLLVNSRFILNIWVGDQVRPSTIFLFLNALYVVLYCHMAIHNQIVNGIGRVFLQLRIAMFTTLIFIPLSFVFIKQFSLGLNGVLLSIIACMLPFNILISLQVKKILNFTAHGFWNK